MSTPKPLGLGRLSREPRLLGKVAVITGASRGFGQGIAVRFVEEGACVALLARGDCSETLALLRTIEGVGTAVDDIALAINCDIGVEAEIVAAVAATTAKFGSSVHVLVNNAAAFIFKSVEDATAEEWDRTAAINVRGHALVTKHYLPAMRAAGGGSVVFQGSVSSYLAQPGCATYAAMKGAIVQLARNCAMDLAKYRIRVNSVCAGTVETPISADERAAHGWSFDEWERLKTADVILGRVGCVREVADATLFLASDEASYITASDLFVDGGQVACTIMPRDH